MLTAKQDKQCALCFHFFKDVEFSNGLHDTAISR
jgi:hypothetical protein